jgi:hypothetical protein
MDAKQKFDQDLQRNKTSLWFMSARPHKILVKIFKALQNPFFDGRVNDLI